MYSDWTAWSDAMLLTRLLASWSECKGGGGEGGEREKEEEGGGEKRTGISMSAFEGRWGS